MKTCVGSEFCRFGTQNSTQMGIDLETMLANMWAPHKVKLAVSGRPRNCAEAGIKDVGVIAVDSGWELYVGGNGGIKTEVAQFLCKVKTAEEVKEYSGAFLQLYREEAITWTVPSATSPASAWTTSRRGWWTTPPTARPCTSGCCSRWKACPTPGPPASPARSARNTSLESHRLRPPWNPPFPSSRWLRVCALDDIPLLGSRVLTRDGGDIALFRRSRNKCSRCWTAARTRAAR